MRILKPLLLAIAVIAQLTGVVYLFIHIETAIMLFIVYGAAFVLLIGVLVKERLKEKKEEEDHDYRDY